MAIVIHVATIHAIIHMARIHIIIHWTTAIHIATPLNAMWLKLTEKNKITGVPNYHHKHT